MIIFFDIDSTLLDTKTYMKKIFGSIEQILNIPQDELNIYVNQYYQTLQSSTDFNYIDFVEFLLASDIDQSLRNANDYRTELLALWDNPQLAQACMYADVTRILEHFQQRFDLGIFSEGYEENQLKKLYLMGIIDYFEQKNMFIKRRKSSPEAIAEFEQLYKRHSKHNSPVIIVDDRIEYLVAYQHLEWVTPYHLVRDQKLSANMNQDLVASATHKQMMTIRSLDDLLAYLQ